MSYAEKGPVADCRRNALAGLVFSGDQTPGIRRVRKRSAFLYQSAAGREIRDERTLRRIQSLVIPPAWTDVWICPTANGHIQATGRDQRGRKQYIYHPRWREHRDRVKYDRLVSFAQSLGALQRRVARDLRRPALDRRKVLATVVRLLQATLIRVGNREYAKANRSFGLTTLRDQHVQVNGSRVQFRFRGKSGVLHAIDLSDRRLAPIIKACQDLPGQELFQYEGDDGKRHTVKSDDVNDYLREATGEDFTAKDFRTWAGTVLAASALREFASFDSQAQAKKQIVAAVERVARSLGNTKTVCRQCYVHPAIFEAYLDGSLREVLRREVDRQLQKSLAHLTPEEAAVYVLLRQRLKRRTESSSARAPSSN